MPTPRARSLLAAGLLAFLFAAACKDEPTVVVKRQVTTEVPGGPEAPMDVSVDMGEPAILGSISELPAFAPVYPGAVIKTRMGKPREDGVGGTLLVMETPDPLEKVAAFYDAQAKKAGVVPSMFVNEDDSAVRIFGGRDGPDSAGGALIAISTSQERTNTEIVITAGMADDQVKVMEENKDGWRSAAGRSVRLQ